MERELKTEKTREAILEEAAELRKFLYKNIPDFHERLIARIEYLRSRHPDYDDYLMYHLVIGSSEARPDKLDFPGEDSLYEWMKREARAS